MADRSAHWAELLTPQLTEAFFIGFSDNARRASMIDPIFHVDTSERAFEEYLGVGQFGSEGWNFGASGRVQYDQRNKGYLERLTHEEFAKGFVVDRKLVEDNLTQISFNDAMELGDAAYRKREKGGASVFINAFTTGTTNQDNMSILGPDGVPLVSNAHPHSQDDSVTQSNEAALSLTVGNVSTLRVTMSKITDDRGDIMDVMPDQILAPPELEDSLIPITGSQLDPASANNAVNPQQGRYQSVIWHYLTDAKAWFLMDSARRSRSLLWLDRIPLEFGKEEDFDTFQAKFRAYMRYSYGWIDWAWCYGSKGA